MAVQYYDKTSPIEAAGFGTLSGNWTDLSWTTSPAGTTTPGAAFTSGNTPTFGGLSNTATGGTIVLNTNATVDGITVQNLTATLKQTISGTAILTFAAITAAISVGTGLELEILPQMAFGTSNISKTGAGRLTLSGTAASTLDAATPGTFTINGGTVYVTRGLSYPLILPTTVKNNTTLAAFNSVDPVRLRLRGTLTLEAGSTVVFGIPA